MRPFILRTLFTLIFSILSTALASVLMYTLPVLEYIGSVMQIIPMLLGFVVGTLVFSVVGVVVALINRKPVLTAVLISIISVFVLTAFYRLSGPTNNFDITLGAFATQSFAVLFSTMSQGSPSGTGRKVYAVATYVLFTVVSILLFLFTASIYLIMEQAFLPNTIVYFELLAALLGALTIMFTLNPMVRGKNGSH